MAPRPLRAALARASGYAEEAAAFMRRRRAERRPFARLYHPGGRATEHAAGTPQGEELFAAAGRLIDVAAEDEP